MEPFGHWASVRLSCSGVSCNKKVLADAYNASHKDFRSLSLPLGLYRPRGLSGLSAVYSVVGRAVARSHLLRLFALGDLYRLTRPGPPYPKGFF